MCWQLIQRTVTYEPVPMAADARHVLLWKARTCSAALTNLSTQFGGACRRSQGGC